MLQGANLETQIDIFKKPKINEGKFPTEAANANNTNKKTWPAESKMAPVILLKGRPSHAGQEKPRTPAPPVHSDNVALWGIGVRHTKGIF